MTVGIEGLKKELDLGFAIFGAISAAKADGKLGLEDLGLLLTLVGPVQSAYSARMSLGEELKDLTVEESADLAAYVATKMSVLNDPTLVAKVVAVMQAMRYNYAAVKAFTG